MIIEHGTMPTKVLLKACKRAVVSGGLITVALIYDNSKCEMFTVHDLIEILVAGFFGSLFLSSVWVLALISCTDLFVESVADVRVIPCILIFFFASLLVACFVGFCLFNNGYFFNYPVWQMIFLGTTTPSLLYANALNNYVVEIRPRAEDNKLF